jgi:speckle-type POZ protein
MLFGSGGPAGGRFKEASGSAAGVVVEDVSYAVFVAMLEFLYTDAVAEILPELAVPLLIAGERWMLPRLKALCEDTIRRGITAHSVVPTLLAAHRHRAAGLKVAPLPTA